jgi:predicted ATPase/class 3 adenylate cyclase
VLRIADLQLTAPGTAARRTGLRADQAGVSDVGHAVRRLARGDAGWNRAHTEGAAVQCRIRGSFADRAATARNPRLHQRWNTCTCHRSPVDAPTETRVLLLTDVVDGAGLAERLGDAAAAAVWTAHDRVARDLLLPWRGREIDKTDGMLLLFDSVDDAAGYALACQRALAALPVPLQARAGLHVGPVVLRENSPDDLARGAKPLEVDGLAKPTAARVMSLAQGGQLLLTHEAVAALRVPRAPPWSLRSLGHWSMKGLSAPLEVFELSEGDNRAQVPADTDKVFRVARRDGGWVPVREIPNNLPQQATSFVGRERERAEIERRLETTRLLTLLGMGGLGKTRLSLQIAQDVMHVHPDGVWFIDLSPIRDPALVSAEAAQVLGVREEPDRTLLQTLCAHLKTRTALLILDNCEHLMQPAAELADALLRAAPKVRIVASSREALRVTGESVYPVLPLPVPGRGASLRALQQSTAVRLFVERAQARNPAFALTESDAGSVAELVAQLEGIPLALELAAARVRSMSVAEIALNLRDRYQLLTGGSRVLQKRQQTLRALVDWSYDLLQPAEQTALRRLGVFLGGFDLRAAEAVCGAEPIVAVEVADLLASLVEKSLVSTRDAAAATRYRMLETIREYAHAKLVEAGDAAAVAERHALHYFEQAKQIRDGLKGAEQAQWIERAETDLDNLRAATSLALAGGVDPVIAVKMAVALQGFWALRGYATEGRTVVQAALALPAVQASDLAQAWTLYVGAALAASQSDHAEARRMLSTCLELRRRMGNPREIAATLSTLSLALSQGGDNEGAAASEREALQLFGELGDEVGVAIGHEHLGRYALRAGDLEAAREQLSLGLDAARRIGSREIEAECERMLGEVALESGDIDGARDAFARSLAISRDSADRPGEAKSLRALGQTDLAQGDLDLAAERLGQALRAFEAQEMREELIGCLEDHARLALAAGQAELAARLAGFVEKSRARFGLERLPRLAVQWRSWVDALCERLGAASFDSAAETGRQWEVDEATGRATALSAA